LNIKDKVQSEYGDIRDFDKLNKSIEDFDPDIIFHLAAQPLVRKSYENTIDTYETNVIGTANLLESCRECDKKRVILNITTDKCYENIEKDYAYTESDQMGGHDPYSSSKGCSELVTSAYRNSFFKKTKSIFLSSVRAGNVIGGGDWSDDRLIPDILESFNNNKPLLIRNPDAIRPWQHVLEPLSGYMMLAKKMYIDCGYDEAWNFGPNLNDSIAVSEIVKFMASKWHEPVTWDIDKNIHPHEATNLKLNIEKVKRRLDWHPKWNIENALTKIMEWNSAFINNKDLEKISLDQINEYQNK
jgi:CDP-glucose 4,6-dehydratase